MNIKTISVIWVLGLSFFYSACIGPTSINKSENKQVPTSYANSLDTLNTAKTKWKVFFTDPNLISLIDSALAKNQELNIVLQEISIAKNDVRARKGAYLPFVGFGLGAGVDKKSQLTSLGANEANIDIVPGKKNPDPLANFISGVNVSWEIDIWKKLRNAKQSAIYKYYASIEGKNFMVTNLISEIAHSYYELLALDNQLNVLKENIALYQNSLEIVRLEKSAARATELAVRRFEAEVLKNQSRQFYIEQRIVETENRINFLAGRFPQKVTRRSEGFNELIPTTIAAGVPSQLLENRPDIKRAELDLLAAKLDVKIAKAEFYPSLMITSGGGYNAFNPVYLIRTPESLIYSMVGNFAAPLINRNAIKAHYYSANLKQVQAIFNFERSILNAHMEVSNQLSNISNLNKSYDLKVLQLQALTESIEISKVLFRSARADYMEVLLTQRDALDARFELIETKNQQMNAMVNLYKALGGGWK